MIEREYQSECRRKIHAEFKEADSTLIVLPTGCGKTVIFSKVIRDFFPRKALVVAHRQELIYQAKDKIERSTGLRVEIEMGEKRAHMGADMLGKAANVLIATVQTLTAGWIGDTPGGRLDKFNPNDFGLLVCDEAHHFTSKSFRKVIEHFRSNHKLKVLGVTATPDRADEESLGQVFETVAFDYEIQQAITDGWLVPIEQTFVRVKDLDFSKVHTSGGDFNVKELSEIMEMERHLHDVVTPSIEIIGNKKALVFTSSVLQAQQLSDLFNRYKKGMSTWVCGATDKQERNIINERFKTGDIQVLCNCGTHTEGFDADRVEVVVMARPTKSRSLYAQMVGRATRPLAGIVDGPATAELRRAAIAVSPKPGCLVVDFVGNSGKHRLVSSFDILGGTITPEVLARATERALEIGKGKPIKTTEIIEQEKERERLRLEEEARKAALRASRAEYSRTRIDPFSVLGINKPADRAWDEGKKLSDKQMNVLRRAGLDPKSLSYSSAKHLIGEILRRWDNNLCTIGQANLLKRHGYDVNMSKEQATKTIDALSRNGWKRLAARPGGNPPPRRKVDGANKPSPVVAAVALQTEEVPF